MSLVRLCTPSSIQLAFGLEPEYHADLPGDLKRATPTGFPAETTLSNDHSVSQEITPNQERPDQTLRESISRVDPAELSSINLTTRGIVRLADNAFELEKGDGIRKPAEGDAVKLKFARIETSLTSGVIQGPSSLPFALEEKNLQTVWVAHDGTYGKGKGQSVTDAILAVIATMTVGQKVMIVEDEESTDENGKGGAI